MNIKDAIALSDEAHIVCSTIYPFPVLFANKAWTNITGYEQHEIVGQTLKMLQGPMTNEERVREMMNSVSHSGSGDCEVVNYTKNGNPYLAKVKVHPIISKLHDVSYISHYMSVTTASEFNDEDNPNRSLIFSLVNAEEYGWLVKTVSDLQSDRDSSCDQRSNTSSNSKDSDGGRGGVKVRRPRKRYNYSSNTGSGSGSDTGSGSSEGRLQSVSAYSSRGTSQEGGSVSSRNGDSADGDNSDDRRRQRGRKPSPTNSSSDEKNSSRSNSISISVGTAEKEAGNTSAEGSDMGSVSMHARNTRKRKSSSRQETGPGQEGNLNSSPSKASRMRTTRRRPPQAL